MIKIVFDRDKDNDEIELGGTGEEIICELVTVCCQTANAVAQETNIPTSEVVTYIAKILLGASKKAEEILSKQGD